jgi:FkbM family methyltransferase
MVTMLAGATSGGLEPGTRKALRRLARPGMACADIGANVGLLTLALARAVGPEGRVWAFEPEPGPHGLLARSLPLYGLSWVSLSATAAGARPGRAVFHVSPILGHSSLYALSDEEEASARLIEVEVAPLDSLLPEGTVLDVVKIDVEGAELDVIAGMSRLLAESPDPALVVEYGPSHLARVGLTADRWFDAFAAQGFAAHAIDEADGRARAVTRQDLADVVSVNLAFVRPGGAAEARLADVG